MQTITNSTESAALGTRLWKAFLLLLVPILAALQIWSLTTWNRYAVPEGRATLGVTLGDPARGSRLPIVAMRPASPLAGVGANLGDVLVFDRSGDSERRVGTNETIGLSIESRTGARHVFVRPVADATALQAGLFARISAILFWPATTIMLVIGALVGWRNAGNAGMRVLSLALLSQCVDFFASRLPGGIIQDWSSKLLFPCAYFVAFVALPYVVLRLPERNPLLRSAIVRVPFCIYSAAWGLLAASLSAERFGVIGSNFLTSSTGVSGPLEICSAFVVILASTLAWRRSIGSERQRVAWVGICLGGLYLMIAVPDIIHALGWLVPSWTRNLSEWVWFASSCGLGYATLRHRLFDVGFAINRAAVYTGTTALLLVAFALCEWAAEHLLQFEGREKSMLLDAGLALGVFLAFHRVRDFVEHWVERILFRQWREREDALRLFVRRAAYATAETPLIESFVGALERFADGAPCAIYLRSSDGSFALQRGSLRDAPPRLDQNDSAVLAMRENDIPLQAEEALLPEGASLALPMSHRRVLNGFTLLGSKKNGDPYRPDEIAVLDFAAKQIGLDLHALRVEALRADVESLRAHAETLQARNEALELAIRSGSGGSIRLDTG
jgi:hypothetical protein